MAESYRLYLDECIHAKAAQAFRDVGVDAVGVHDINTLRLDDSAQLELASTENRILVTYNACDFVALHQQWIDNNNVHGGILIGPDYKHRVGAFVRDVRATLREDRERRGSEDYDWVRGELLWIRRHGAIHEVREE